MQAIKDRAGTVYESNTETQSLICIRLKTLCLCVSVFRKKHQVIFFIITKSCLRFVHTVLLVFILLFRFFCLLLQRNDLILSIWQQ